jgi:hypothetical protein
MKFVKFYCNRHKRNFFIKPEEVTLIQDEECKAWGKTEISVKGGTYVSGLSDVHVSETPEEVIKMLAA